MRELIVGALALVLGVVLGGLLPRAEVRRLQIEMAELEERECRTGLGSELTGLLMRPPIPAPEPEGEPTLDEPPADAPEPGFHVEVGAEGASEEPPVVETLETAKTALQLRSTQARASLVEDAEPDEAQMEAFDAAVDDMNADLREIALEAAAVLAEGGEPTRREAMVFVADVLDVMIAAEDRMTESLDEEQRGAVADEALDPFSYIDPALLDLFSELGP